MWTLKSHLLFHEWSSWAKIFWSNMPLLFAGAILISLLGAFRPKWYLTLLLSFLMALIYQRNIWITDAGDKLFVILLVWQALLLASKNRCFSFLKWLFALQLGLIYVQNGFFKYNEVWMESGTALNFLWSYPGIAFKWIWPLSKYDLSWPSRLVPVLEMLLPLFIFTRFRIWIAGIFILFHVLNACMLNVGFIHYIMLMWWILFIVVIKTDDRSKNIRPPLVVAIMWTLLNLIQTCLAFSHTRLPMKLDHFLANYYLKQHWSIFEEARNQIPQYSFACFNETHVIDCGPKIKHFSKRDHWTKGEVGFMDKMAFRKLPGAVRKDFHRYLCLLHPEAKTIRVKLQITHRNLRTLEVEKIEDRDFGVGESCSSTRTHP